MPKTLAETMEVDDAQSFDGELSLFMNDSTPDSAHYLDPLALVIKAACLEWPKLEPRLPSVAGYQWRVWIEGGKRPSEQSYILALLPPASFGEQGNEIFGDPNRSAVRIAAHFDSAPVVVFVSSKSSELGVRAISILSNLVLTGTITDSLMVR